MSRAARAGTKRGFTLLELMAVVALLAILAAFAVLNYRDLLASAHEAGCVANMRGLTVALHSYLQDHAAVWPQGPNPNQENAWEDFWLVRLSPYGISEKSWQCPGFNGMAASAGIPVKERPRVHYVPTTFGPEAGLAYRWAKQPWLIERASSHRNGAHICFQDGTVKSFNKVLAEMGVR